MKQIWADTHRKTLRYENFAFGGVAEHFGTLNQFHHYINRTGSMDQSRFATSFAVAYRHKWVK